MGASSAACSKMWSLHTGSSMMKLRGKMGRREFAVMSGRQALQ